MFDHLLESYHRDDSYKWSNIGFGKEIQKLASIEVYFTHLIWSSELGWKSVTHGQTDRQTGRRTYRRRRSDP